jgi:glutathione S-transferase
MLTSRRAWLRRGSEAPVITLYTFGRNFGLPDGSPFVVKTMLLLKMAGLAYREKTAAPFKAPKNKLPFIEDDGEIIEDSTFIRLHIEKQYGFDFDAGLTGEQKAIGWALEKTCEDHLYWIVFAERWFDDANFVKGPAHFFDALPVPLRHVVRAAIRRKMRRDAWGQGLVRHSPAQRAELARRGLRAFSTLLGDKPYLFGDRPHGADATLGAFAMGALCPLFDSATREEAERLPNFVAYARRIEAKSFPGAE